MTNSSDLDKLSDYELYDLAKRLIMRESVSTSTSERMLKLVFAECRKRDIEIFNDAAIDAAGELSLAEQQLLGLSLGIATHGSDLSLAEIAYLANIERSSISSDDMFADVFDIRRDALLIVNVRGDSMIGAGIDDGDTLFAEATDEIHNGKIMIVSVNGKLFVKRIRVELGSLWLYSENEKYPPYGTENACDFKIIGLVRKIIKSAN